MRVMPLRVTPAAAAAARSPPRTAPSGTRSRGWTGDACSRAAEAVRRGGWAAWSCDGVVSSGKSGKKGGFAMRSAAAVGSAPWVLLPELAR